MVQSPSVPHFPITKPRLGVSPLATGPEGAPEDAPEDATVETADDSTDDATNDCAAGFDCPPQPASVIAVTTAAVTTVAN
jgi:hypothetical protein